MINNRIRLMSCALVGYLAGVFSARPSSLPSPKWDPFPSNSKRTRISSWRGAKMRAQRQAIDGIGNGYRRIPVAAPAGYFWKQDRGALDCVPRIDPHSLPWRLYRKS